MNHIDIEDQDILLQSNGSDKHRKQRHVNVRDHGRKSIRKLCRKQKLQKGAFMSVLCQPFSFNYLHHSEYVAEIVPEYFYILNSRWPPSLNIVYYDIL